MNWLEQYIWGAVAGGSIVDAYLLLDRYAYRGRHRRDEAP